MAKRRTTFGKMQRDRDKQEKAREKAERRAARSAERDDEDTDEEPSATRDEAATMEALAALHRAYDDGEVSLDDFMNRREELQAALQQD